MTDEIRRSEALVPGEAFTRLPSLTPMDILRDAIERDRSIEVLEKLMDLQDRWEKNNARRAFDEALSLAKAEIPTIAKNRQVAFDSKKPGAARTDYRYEDLAEIARTVDPILGKHGLSYRFRTTSNINEPIVVTCIVSHRMGHYEENTLSGGRDESGNKNSIQAIGSAITYLQRYTLKAALGLAASNDDDGRAAAGDAIKQDEDQPPLVSAQQCEMLALALNETTVIPEKFYAYFKIEKMEQMPAHRYPEAMTLLEQRRGPKMNEKKDERPSV